MVSAEAYMESGNAEQRNQKGLVQGDSSEGSNLTENPDPGTARGTYRERNS